MKRLLEEVFLYKVGLCYCCLLLCWGAVAARAFDHDEEIRRIKDDEAEFWQRFLYQYNRDDDRGFGFSLDLSIGPSPAPGPPPTPPPIPTRRPIPVPPSPLPATKSPTGGGPGSKRPTTPRPSTRRAPTASPTRQPRPATKTPTPMPTADAPVNGEPTKGPQLSPTQTCPEVCFTISQNGQLIDAVPVIQTGGPIQGLYAHDNGSFNGDDVIPPRSQVSQILIHGHGVGVGAMACELSLLILHDDRNDGSGGRVEMDITGDWSNIIVPDDLPTGESGGDSYVYNSETDSTRLTWNWEECCTDGAAHILTDFPSNDCITVRPKFSQGIDRWVFVRAPASVDAPATETSLIDLDPTVSLQLCRVSESCPHRTTPAPQVQPATSAPITPAPAAIPSSTRSPVSPSTPAPNDPLPPVPVTPSTRAPLSPPTAAPIPRLTLMPVPSTSTPAPVVSPQTTSVPAMPPSVAPNDPITLAPVRLPSRAPMAPPRPTGAPVRPPTRTPLRPPTAAPVTPPTRAPQQLRPPTAAPVTPPTRAPVRPPTVAPVTPPTRAPIRPPTARPVTPPTRAPIRPPTVRPVTPPTRAPARPPTAAPVRPPTAAPVQPPTAAPATPPTQGPAEPMTLLFLIQNTAEFSILDAAIQAADMGRNSPPKLADLLNDPDASLTAFAPINGAFMDLEAIAPGYLDQLLLPAFSLHLYNILSYHIANGLVTSDTFPVTDLAMLSSGMIDISMDGLIQSASPDPSQILDPPDFVASNGIAQVITDVLLPEFVSQNVLTALQASPETFSSLLRLIEAAGLEDTIAGLNGVTFLAPTNDAIMPQTEEFLLMDGNEDILLAVLSYHILNSVVNYVIQSVPNILLKETLQGENVIVGLIFGDNQEVIVSFNQANRRGERLTQQNIIYDVNTILVPPTMSSVVPRSLDQEEFEPDVVVESSIPTDRSFIEESTSPPMSIEQLTQMVNYEYSTWKDWPLKPAEAGASTSSAALLTDRIRLKFSTWNEG